MIPLHSTHSRIVGDLIYSGGRFALVASRFNGFLVEQLLQGATEALRLHGCPEEAMDIIRVPGAFELPVTIKAVMETRQPRAVVALGVVIRGATAHFEHIANSCTSGLQQLALAHGIPVGFGVITAETLDQAIERSGTKAGNKGAEAALAALETANLIAALQQSGQ
jgi:6,7-dimethyl-8-ribityllumazine synthase